MIFDTHIHTEFSTDSKMCLEKAIGRAEMLDIGLTITEHYDADADGDERFFKVDTDAYFKAYEKYRSNNLLLGIEMGLSAENIKVNKKMAESYPFDFILGSIHIINGIDLYVGYCKMEPHRATPYLEYLEVTLAMIMENDCFDSLGHIDYPSRYSSFSPREIKYATYSDIYDKIFMELINKDKSIEINTRRLDDNRNLENLHRLYSRYHELGGRHVTIGSDAHNVDAIGCNFDKALEMVRDIGLSAVYYKDRKKMTA